ncbi:MAG: fructosamine kinase family protein [Bacteroidia bacterium]|nr:fructosamine kinase family protein [Bacteroidia bacterium]
MNAKILEKALTITLNYPTQLYSFHSIGSNNFNQQFKVLSDSGAYFIKVHESNKYGKVFEKEYQGLKILEKSSQVRVVKAIGTCSFESFDFFVSEFVESAPQTRNFYENLGVSLAKLHLESNRNFGLSDDNYLGYASQTNHRHSKWAQFYIKCRLLPNIRKASELGFLDTLMLSKFEKYLKIVEVVFPEEMPSLLHGNLIQQHILTNQDGNVVLSSPSVYYGHREMDIARTKNIGSLPKAFYDTYNEVFPLNVDWELRVDFCKMYYDLVNLNTFGSPYLPMVVNNLNKWAN